MLIPEVRLFSCLRILIICLHYEFNYLCIYKTNSYLV
ncbi:hypothetical protein M2137_000417 [Parabacteroides sp. PFB2-10]|nr:hypothetical protein [Parabacteroides sp. PFB2-10]